MVYPSTAIRSSRWASGRSRRTIDMLTRWHDAPTVACGCRASSSRRSSTRTAAGVADRRREADRNESHPAPEPRTSSADILARQHTGQEDQPVLGRVADHRRRHQRRPDGYKTGTTTDNSRCPRVRLPCAPGRPEAPPSPRACGWATATGPNKGNLSLDSSGAPLVGDPGGCPARAIGISPLQTRRVLNSRRVDTCFSDLQSRTVPSNTVKELFLPGTVPRSATDPRRSCRRGVRSAVAGRMRGAHGQGGVPRPFSQGEPRFPCLAGVYAGLGHSCRKGSGRCRGPKRRRGDAYFYSSTFRRPGEWGWGAPTEALHACTRGSRCHDRCPPPTPPPSAPLKASNAYQPAPTPAPTPRSRPTRRPRRQRQDTQTGRRQTHRHADLIPARPLQPRLTIVAPSPPSPRLTGPNGPRQRMGRRRRRTASRSAPVPRP